MITRLSHFYFEDGYLICWFETQQNFEKVNDTNKYALINSYKYFVYRPINLKIITLVLMKSRTMFLTTEIPLFKFILQLHL